VATDGVGRAQVMLMNDTGDLDRFVPHADRSRSTRKLRG
jgi:hypothetical protein